MPDVKLYLPRTMFEHSDPMTEKLKNGYRLEDAVRRMVATALNCEDENGEFVLNQPEVVDVHVFPYGGPNYQLHSNVKVIIEVIGYGYEDRLRNMAKRLEFIRDHFRDLCENPDLKISVSFIPIPVGCWVGS